MNNPLNGEETVTGFFNLLVHAAKDPGIFALPERSTVAG